MKEGGWWGSEGVKEGGWWGSEGVREGVREGGRVRDNNVVGDTVNRYT